MLRKVLRLSSSPRALLRSVLALDDSPHAISLGVAVGIFFGLTPTVGVQTVLILATVFLTRRVCYFNGAAAMAATYISNPFTMVPMYYFWYRLGCTFVGGHASLDQFETLLQAEGLAGWWNAMCTVGAEIGAPMFLGALMTAPFGSLLAYPLCYMILKWVRCVPSRKEQAKSTDEEKTPGASSVARPMGRVVNTDSSDDDESVRTACLSSK